MTEECDSTPLSSKINTALEYLKQPSTIKALATALGAVGYAIDQSKAVEILLGLQAFFGMINLFYDANPRKSISAEAPSAEVSVSALDKVLTTAQLAELVRMRKEKIAADRVRVK